MNLDVCWNCGNTTQAGKFNMLDNPCTPRVPHSGSAAANSAATNSAATNSAANNSAATNSTN
jgi:hypothetical protein